MGFERFEGVLILEFVELVMCTAVSFVPFPRRNEPVAALLEYFFEYHIHWAV